MCPIGRGLFVIAYGTAKSIHYVIMNCNWEKLKFFGKAGVWVEEIPLSPFSRLTPVHAYELK